jgi:hypothetical protein
MFVKYIIGILTLLLIGVSGAALYFYNQSGSSQNPSPSAKAEAAALVQEVGKLIVLPEGETPTIATVSDPERLKEQPFFAKAKAGDKVLLYSTARKAYLYDPIAKKLLEVAPLNIGGEVGQ